MSTSTCPACSGPLDPRTAGVTGAGVVCQRCVLGELDADRAQQAAGEWRRGAPRSGSVTGLLVSGALFTSRELSRQQIWLDARTLAIPRFGSGVELWHFGEEALITATVSKDRCTRANERALATPSEWRRLASEHKSRPWATLTQVTLEEGTPRLWFGSERVMVFADDRKAVDALIDERVVGWTKTERRMTLLESMATPGCALALGVGVLLPIFALTWWVGSWDWDGLFAELEDHGPRRRRGQAWILLWLGWIVGAAGPWLSGIAFGLVALVAFGMAIARLRVRPIVTTFAPPSAGAASAQ